jgi:energy-coupling factor transport system ATP-binding protein
MRRGAETTRVLVRLEGLGIHYPCGVRALEGVTLSIRSGECVFLTGPSGSGKTTLLHLLRGLVPTHIPAAVTGRRLGEILEDWASVGLVFQNPETQLFFQTVEEELAFGPENLGVPAASIRADLRSIEERLTLASVCARNPRSLSSGEKQRVAIGAVLAMRPRLLLLDEPVSLLDRSGRDTLAEILGSLKREGMTLVIADHVLGGLGPLVDRVLVLEGGRLRGEIPTGGRDPAGILSDFGLAPPTGRSGNLGRQGSSRGVESILTMKDVTFQYPGGGGLCRVSLSVGKGEVLGICGANGSGKTTLLRAAAGLAPAQEGEIKVFGVRDPRPEKLLGKVAMVMQNPERQIFEESAEAEVSFTLRRMQQAVARPSKRVPADREVHGRAVQALGRLGLKDLAQRNPLSLSLGEQRRLVCASAMASNPGLLLLDEPTSGLDWPNRWLLINWIRELQETYGTTVLVASHDQDLLESLCDRSIGLDRGRLVDA